MKFKIRSKIKKLANGSTSVKILRNQKVTYDPQIDSYVIETDILNEQVHYSTIPSYIFDQLYNKSWEADK
jgi:hypothetical protein